MHLPNLKQWNTRNCILRSRRRRKKILIIWSHHLLSQKPVDFISIVELQYRLLLKNWNCLLDGISSFIQDWNKIWWLAQEMEREKDSLAIFGAWKMGDTYSGKWGPFWIPERHSEDRNGKMEMVTISWTRFWPFPAEVWVNINDREAGRSRICEMTRVLNWRQNIPFPNRLTSLGTFMDGIFSSAFWHSTVRRKRIG